MTTFLATILLSFITFLAPTSHAVEVNEYPLGTVGQTLVGSPPHPGNFTGDFEYGSVIKLSYDGRFMAVGASSLQDGAVFLYEREDLHGEAIASEVRWNLVWELHGKPGEGIGDRISISLDGTKIAVRRYDASHGDVEVYKYDQVSQQMRLLGSPVSPCKGNSRGKAVLLGEAAQGGPFPYATVLLVSCESFDRARGKVEVFRLDDSSGSWESLQVIEGGYSSGRFGWALGFADYGSTYYIVVSSPNYDEDRGMVQILPLGLNESDAWLAKEQSNFTGAEKGSRFGFALEMDVLKDMVISAPQCSGGGVARGCVHAYRSKLNDAGTHWIWSPHGEVKTGQNNNDRFGTALAISQQGGRMAASSFHSHRQTGYARLYESVAAGESMEMLYEIWGAAPMGRWGYAIALNGFSGSMLATGATRKKNGDGVSVGDVRVLLDESPFCGKSTFTRDNPFLNRLKCRQYYLHDPPSSECGDIIYDQFHCSWVWNPNQEWPSASPSSILSTSPSVAPSGSPSKVPSVAPSGTPSKAPSVAPSGSPSKAPRTEPTTSPTRHPTNFPTATNNEVPSDGPSSVPSSTFMPVSFLASTFLPSSTATSSPSTESPFPQHYLRQIGPTVVGPPVSPEAGNQSSYLDFGTVVKLSDEGDYMAVGAPSEEGSGAVFLYAREDFNDDNGNPDYNWNLIWELWGEPGEAIGDRLSLSKDGFTVALRRYSVLHGDVEVYRFDTATREVSMLGSPLYPCKEENSTGKALHLGYTTRPYTSAFPDTTWLLISCESFDRARGKVEAFRFDSSIGDWASFTKIYGLAQGRRFGWAIGFSGTVDFTPKREHPLFRIAISSPNYDGNRGMVQVLTVDEFGGWAQFGKTFMGQQKGDLFGFAIDLSTRGRMGAYNSAPFLVVGSPQASGGGSVRGCVQVFTWKRLTIHSPLRWNQHGKTLTGVADNDRFGTAVSVSSTGERMAASSYHHQHQTGIVRLYDLFLEMTEVGELLGETPLDRWGVSVSLNGPGSMLASGATRATYYGNEDTAGSVKVYLDQSPFCWVPTGNNPFHERLRCYKSPASNTPEGCSNSYSFQVGRVCEWITPPEASLSTPPPLVSDDFEKDKDGNASVKACACDRDSGECLETPVPSDGTTDYDLCIIFDGGAAFPEIQHLSLSLGHGQDTNSAAIVDEGATINNGSSMNCNDVACHVQTQMESSYLNDSGSEGVSLSVSMRVSYQSEGQRRNLRAKTAGADSAVSNSEIEFSKLVRLGGVN